MDGLKILFKKCFLLESRPGHWKQWQTVVKIGSVQALAGI